MSAIYRTFPAATGAYLHLSYGEDTEARATSLVRELRARR